MHRQLEAVHRFPPDRPFGCAIMPIAPGIRRAALQVKPRQVDLGVNLPSGLPQIRERYRASLANQPSSFNQDSEDPRVDTALTFKMGDPLEHSGPGLLNHFFRQPPIRDENQGA